MTNAQVWTDGYCPLLSFSEEEEEDEDDDDDDDHADNHSDSDENRLEEETPEAESAEETPGKEAQAMDQMANIKFKSQEVADDHRSTPKTAELEDPVRHFFGFPKSSVSLTRVVSSL